MKDAERGRRTVGLGIPWWLWAGLGVFLAVTVAGYLSPRAGASAQVRFLQGLFGFTAGRAHLVVVAARKLGHLLGYGFLGVVFAYLRRGWPANRRLLWAAVLALAVAATDEWIQTWLPWRSGAATDVLLDFFASLLGAGVAVARSLREEQRTITSADTTPKP